MDKQHREVREKLQRMAPARATEYVAAVGLPPAEAFCIIECDIKGKSCLQVADALFASVEYVKRSRRRGYAKIVDHIKNQ
nr:MAG TPA: Sigma factor AlgU negative regulatory factor, TRANSCRIPTION.96A [Caudoviricetes sp.]